TASLLPTYRGEKRVQQRTSAGVTGAYVIVTCLFFAWGFITSLNDPVVTAVKGIFCLTDVRAQLSAFAFFIAYGVVSFPAALLLLKGIETKQCAATTQAARLGSLAGIDRAYFWICGFIIALALLFVIFRRTVTEAAPPPSQEIARRGIVAVIRDALSSRWAVLGGIAIFLYVGAEVAIGTQMAFFLHSDSVWGRSDAPFSYPLVGHIMGNDGIFGVSAEEAGKAVALHWGGAMVGRAIGSALLARVRAAILLSVFTAAACLMCLYVFSVGGVAAG